jgi:dTDP-4-dehydrorhamnose reductase
MKVLVTGGSSLLGKYLAATKPNNVTLGCTWYSNFVSSTHYHLDIMDRTQVHNVFNYLKPDIVIHCAAIGDVNLAEIDYQAVYETNVLGTENIIRAAKRVNAKVVYVSSNAVFRGNEPPYAEDNRCDSVNNYGKIKRKAERLLIDWPDLDWLIIRPFMLYGWPYTGGRGNWGATIINKLGTKEPIKLVNDTIWMPTYAEDMAKAIWRLIEVGWWGGVYHIASPERATLHTFGLKIAKVYGFDIGLIEGVSSSHFPTIAPRPHDTTYNLDKITRLGIKLDGIESGIRRMRDESNR